jgi:hypothetical protein
LTWALVAWLAFMASTYAALRIYKGGGWIAFRTAWTGRPSCPSCRLEMVELPKRAFPPRSYTVWACVRCTNALVTAAEGQGDVPACPACHQHALLAPSWRLPANDQGEPQVQVHELCPVCGHQAVEEFPELDADPRLGQVIQFPGRQNQAE